ncbi:MAG: hypothetical protein ACRDR6_03105 [Pseudonocardiaceae bacterium]
MSRTVLCTPLRVEQVALRGARHTLRLVRTGMGPHRASSTAAALAATPTPLLLAGLAAARTPQVRPGHIVVASEVRAGIPSAPYPPSSTAELFSRLRTALLSNSATAVPIPNRVEVASAPLLAGALRRLGLTVHVGPISSVSRIAWAPVSDGALAVDMESAQLAAAGAPFAVVRAIVDTPDHPLWSLGTPRRGVRALRALRACQPALEWWAAATGPREILLTDPRSLTGQVDLALVVGSLDLVAAARRAGVPAYLVQDTHEIDLRWLAGTTRLGIIADASTPPRLVARIVHCLGGLGPLRSTECHRHATREVV